MKLLISGSAGYIGSRFDSYGQEYGQEVVVLDDFSICHEWVVKKSLDIHHHLKIESN